MTGFNASPLGMILQSSGDEPLSRQGIEKAIINAQSYGKIRSDVIVSTSLIRGYYGAVLNAISEALYYGRMPVIIPTIRAIELDFAGHSSSPLALTGFDNYPDHAYRCQCPPEPTFQVPLNNHYPAKEIFLKYIKKNINQSAGIPVELGGTEQYVELQDIRFPKPPKLCLPKVRQRESNNKFTHRIYELLRDIALCYEHGTVKLETHGIYILFMLNLMMDEKPAYVEGRAHRNGYGSVLEYELSKSGKIHLKNACINGSPKQIAALFRSGH